MNAKKAFSFIENMAIITVLGVILVMVLPKLMNYQSKINKQLALRRAITTYQVVLTKELVGTTGLRTTDDADDYLKDDSYSGIVDRFDTKSKNCSDTGCNFTTNSGNKWDVGTPSRALISLKENKTPTFNDAKDNNNTNTFIIPFEMLNGNLKVMFNKSANNEETKNAINKTLNFINE